MRTTIPEHMQAVQLEGPGGPWSVRQIPVPQPGPGQVLIRMAAAPINPSDLGMFGRGASGDQRSFPVAQGYEGSGTVVAAGLGLLPRLLLGRRVACAALPPSGGTWAEYMVTAATLCVPLAKRVSLEQGAMMLVNPMTAWAFVDIAKRDKHAAIVSTAAASALGRMIWRLGSRQGLPIINIVRRQEQVEALRSQGAQHVLDSSNPDFARQLRTMAHRLKATLLLDAVGGEMTHQLVEASPFGSSIMLYGNLSRERASIMPVALYFGDKRVVGFYLANWVAKKSFLNVLSDSQRVQRLLGDDLRTTVQRRLPLPAVQQAVEMYKRNMSDGKVLLVANPQEVPLD